MYGCTALPWIGPGRTSATCTVRSSRFSGCVRSRLCICARLSIWKRPTVSAAWIAAQAHDLVDGVLDGGEHPEPEQVDLEEAGVRTRVLVPLADLPARHRRRHHRDEVDERSGRDDHAARMLRDVARQSCDLARQLAERAPARTGMRARNTFELLPDSRPVPALPAAGHALVLAEPKAD